jgi:branched-chain amino acid transport system substrate-binding protein
MDTSPLRIGYCLSLSGALASNGKTARLAHQIWQENVNTNGQLLGRPVELVCLDDQTNPKLVADIYQRLLDGTQAILPRPDGARGQREV